MTSGDWLALIVGAFGFGIMAGRWLPSSQRDFWSEKGYQDGLKAMRSVAAHASDCPLSIAQCTCGGVEGWPATPPSEGDPWELAAQRLRIYTTGTPEWFRRAIPPVGSVEEEKLLRGCAGWLEPYIRHLLRQMQYDAEQNKPPYTNEELQAAKRAAKEYGSRIPQ
jgi:hypothetical protein